MRDANQLAIEEKIRKELGDIYCTFFSKTNQELITKDKYDLERYLIRMSKAKVAVIKTLINNGVPSNLILYQLTAFNLAIEACLDRLEARRYRGNHDRTI